MLKLDQMDCQPNRRRGSEPTSWMDATPNGKSPLGDQEALARLIGLARYQR
jgi:hypothetical protein